MSPQHDVIAMKKIVFTGFEDVVLVFRLPQCPHGRREFSAAGNKGVLGLYLWKKPPLYLLSNCAPLGPAYTSRTFASSAVTQKVFKRNTDLCKWGCWGDCGVETVVTGGGMGLKRAVGSKTAFSTRKALCCLFTHCVGLLVCDKASYHITTPPPCLSRYNSLRHSISLGFNVIDQPKAAKLSVDVVPTFRNSRFFIILNNFPCNKTRCVKCETSWSF